MDVKHFAFLARQPSASLQPRERFWGMPKRGIALILANAMFWQPMWAQADGIVVSGGSTSLGAAGNGVPIVNIAAPNANGLSHNQYQQYNVGSQGVILNNATAQTQSTQLGGIIIGNSNLQGQAASTILNEVVSNNRTQLKGYTEVAGSSAKVIIANPYGITCDGCGFINTPQATLTTGKPVLDQGQITRYEVQGGDVSLEGAGLNATNLDQFDIITRSAKVNAELHAKKLNIIAGRNNVDAQTLDATALADDGSVKPELAIDSSALGGMYAGAIRLVGTEQGVGVRLNGEMAASAGDLNIDANGLLTMARTTASGDVTVKAQSVQANEALHAGGNLDIDANGDLSSQKSLAAAGNVTLTSQGLLSNQGAIEAGINADNTRNTTGDVKIEAKNLRNAGSVVAAGTLGVTAGQALDNSKGVMGARAGTATIIAGGRLDNTEGTLQAATALVVTGADALNVSGNLLGQTVTFTGTSLDNTNGLIGASVGAARVTTTGKLDNSGGTLQAETALTVTGGDVLNVSGNLLGQTVTFTGASLNNTSGLIGASAGAARVTTTGKLDNTAGTLQAETGLVVGGAELVNKNGTLSGQTVTVTGTSLDNTQGRINARNGALTVTSSGALDNTEGTLQAATDLVVGGTELVSNNGKMLGQTVTVTGTSLDNTKGMIAASTGVTRVTTTGTLDNTEGTLQAATDLTVTGADVLNVSGNLLGQTVTFTGASLDNTGGLIGASVGATTVTSSGRVDNTRGRLLAETGLVVSGTELVNNSGKLLGQTVRVTGSSLDNLQGLIDARTGAATVISTGRLDNTGGTLQAATDLVVGGTTMVSQGGSLLGQNVTVTGTSFDNSQQGSVIADSGTLTVTLAQALDNSQGRLQSTVGDLTVTAGSLLNRLGVIVGDQVQLTSTLAGLDNQGGQVLGNRLVVDTKTDIDNRVSGQLVSGSDGLKLTASALQNQNGSILAGGSLADIDLAQGNLDNQGGNISARDVTLNAGDVDNSNGSLTSLAGNLNLTLGRLTNQGGLIEASQALLLNAKSLDNSASGRVLAHQGTLSRLALQGDLDNRNGRIAIGSQALDLQAVTLFNSGGQIEHAATGQFSLLSTSLQGAQGRLVGLGSGDWNITNVDGTGVWHFNDAFDIRGLQSMALYAGDRLSSASSLSLEAVSLNNAGELLSDGNLTLKLSGDVTNQGLISTQQVLSLAAANLTQNGGRMASGGNAELTLGGTLDNLGRLTSSGNLSVVANRIDNRGTLGAQQLLTLTATRDINNQADSLIFAGGAMTLRADSLLNRYADIYSQGALSFSAVDGSRASLLSNLSASIESASDVDIKVRELNNAKAEFEATQKIASRRIEINCLFCKDNYHWGYYIVRTVYEGSILKDSPASRLLANRDLLLDTVTVTNGQSLLAANRNSTITATNFYNRGVTLDNREENANYYFTGSQSAYRVVESASNGWNARNAHLPIEQQEAIPTNVTNLGVESTTNTIRPGNGATYTGTVQAGNTLAINVSGELVNGSLDDHGTAQLIGATLDSSTTGAGQQQIILGTPVGASGPVKDVQRVEAVAADGSVSVSFVPVDFSGAPFVSVDPTALTGFRLPQGEYGLFTPTRNPASPYRIETNPTLTDTTRFMSSDYLLGQLGYDTTEASRRLGDGRYETRLVADAVRAQTGQRFLADGLSSDYEQFQYLMDNAIASKDKLNLSVGVGLTSEQVAALTHDIVWMEERVIEGETVLTPVLYLAKVDSRDLRGGSLVQGRNVEMITGGDLKSVGTLRASEDLTIVSGGSLYQGGLAQANDQLTMLAQGSIRNAMAGQIRATTVSLTSLTGDIINDRTAVQFKLGGGSTTQVDAGSSISATTALTINAANDLTNKGQISSGGDATLTAGNDINLLAVQDRTVTRGRLRRDLHVEETITQLGSSITAGGNLTLEAGNDLNAVASKASAGENLTVTAGQDVNLASAADEHNIESRDKKGKKKIHEVDNESRQVASEFTAGEDLSIAAGRDATLMASKLKAGDEAYVYAGQNLSLIAAQNSTYTLYDMKKKGSFGSKAAKRDEVTDVRNIGSEITTGGDLTLKSGGDQLYQVAKLDSGNDLTLESGGAITFEGVKDLHDESHTKSKNSAAWFSMKGKGTTDETLRQSELVAQGKIVIKAVDGLRIDIKQVDQQTVSQTIDAMVQADPQLAWLKEAEKRGDVDWRQVKEIHESFKYNNSGLGPAAQIAIAILMTVMLGPAGVGLGGWSLAGASSLATTGTVATINNKGDLGAGVKAMISKDGLTNAAIAAVTAGVAENYLGDMTMTKEVNGKTVIDLGSVEAVSHFAGQQLINNTSAAVIAKAFGRDMTLSGILQSAIYNTLAAYSFDQVGNLGLKTGSPEKIALHAMVGGMIAEASGSDFAVGAMAAGVNEAFANQLRRMSAQIDPENRDHLMLMSSQLLGVLAAAVVSDEASNLQSGSWVASNATLYNNLNHSDMSDFVGDMQSCGSDEDCQRKTWVGGKYQQASDEVSDWSKNAVSGVVAKSMLNQIQGGLTALKELNCTTVTCDQYKALLTKRALDDLTELAKVTGAWEHATSIAALAIPAGVRGPNTIDNINSLRTQEYIERFWRAREASVGAKGAGTLANAERGTLTEANFAQNKIKSDRSFSEDGQKVYSELAGTPIKTVDDLAGALRAGTIKPNQLPVDYVDMNGTRLILNTRTSTALEQAAIPRSEWFGRNQTGVEAYPGKTFNDLAADQLKNNKLPPTGAEQLNSVRP
ncbi:filamentous hemagglutinin N-terminal domain-containing protein [Pseudomonas sp. NPDC089734]|uniref:two-partner secretion domain-containing protein n=1 Tax=Pseudomonas sp. NPDC089734 TaxID=3364469 RepID=UPI003820DC22